VSLSQIFGNIPDAYKNMKVSSCKSQIRCVPEDRAAVICLRFLSSDGKFFFLVTESLYRIFQSHFCSTKMGGIYKNSTAFSYLPKSTVRD
jgi:hypothetical protein